MLELIMTILSGAILGVFGWAFQLNNRVTVLETKREDMMILMDEKLDGLGARLERIERSMNGYLKKETH